MFSFSSKPAAGSGSGDAMKDMVRKWTRDIRSETNSLDRQIRELNRDIEKLKRDAQLLGKKGQMNNVKSLCKSIVQARAGIERMEIAKSQLESMSMQLKEQYVTVAAMVKVTGTISKSTSIMATMGRLMNVPEVMGTARKLGAEMMKAGVMNEVIGETMDEAMNVNVEDVDEVVDHVLWEVTKGEMGVAPPVSTPAVSVPTSASPVAPSRTAVVAGEE